MTRYLPALGALLALLLPCVSRPVWAEEPVFTAAELAAVNSLASARGRCAVLGAFSPAAGESVWGFGLDPSGAEVNDTTVFEIGSVTKVFTGLLLADSVARGELQLDSSLADLLDVSLSDAVSPVTLEQLITHSSGLRRLPGNFLPQDWADPYADYGDEELIAYLGEATLQSTPGEAYAYSNLGVGLVGWLIARRLETSLEDALARRVLRPLGLEHTGFDRPDCLPGQTAAGATSRWRFQDTVAGAGALHSTARDMLTLLAAHLAPPSDPQTLREALESAPQARFEIMPRASVGLAWHRSNVGGRELVWHNGATGGFSSYVGYCPARQVALVLLVNVACPDLTTPLGVKLLVRLAERAR